MVSADTKLSDLFRTHKEAVAIFQNLGLNCPACKGQAQDTIAKVAVNNGLDVNVLLDALNGKN